MENSFEKDFQMIKPLINWIYLYPLTVIPLSVMSWCLALALKSVNAENFEFCKGMANQTKLA